MVRLTWQIVNQLWKNMNIEIWAWISVADRILEEVKTYGFNSFSSSASKFSLSDSYLVIHDNNYEGEDD